MLVGMRHQDYRSEFRLISTERGRQIGIKQRFDGISTGFGAT
ncbi:MAG: hypothetical protein A07HR60_02033, partial [uncultured archaeon A07HR60]